MTEQPDFIYFECPECGFDSVQRKGFTGVRGVPCALATAGMMLVCGNVSVALATSLRGLTLGLERGPSRRRGGHD